MPFQEDSGPMDTPNLLGFGNAAHAPQTVRQSPKNPLLNRAGFSCPDPVVKFSFVSHLQKTS